MAVRRVFALQNNFVQRDASSDIGICTVASLQWAKQTLKLKRGLGSADELGLTDHQMNALMAIWRRFDNNPAAQTEGMGLRMVGPDTLVNSFIKLQQKVNATAPHTCIFWNSHHTMGYRVSSRFKKEWEFFDQEQGLYLADNEADIRQQMQATFANGGYQPIMGMRVLDI